MTIARGAHLYPCRTQKLSPVVSMILGGGLPGKVDSCRNKHSSIAQLAEHAAVNRRVVRSSRTQGATPIDDFTDDCMVSGIRFRVMIIWLSITLIFFTHFCTIVFFIFPSSSSKFLKSFPKICFTLALYLKQDFN